MTSHLLTLAEAADRLGINRPRPGRWLKLHVLAQERRIGRQVLVRHGRQAVRTHYLVNLATLRRWCPDLFDQRDEVLKAASTLAKGTDAKLERIDDRLDEVDSKLAAIMVAMQRLQVAR